MSHGQVSGVVRHPISNATGDGVIGVSQEWYVVFHVIQDVTLQEGKLTYNPIHLYCPRGEICLATKNITNIKTLHIKY